MCAEQSLATLVMTLGLTVRKVLLFSSFVLFAAEGGPNQDTIHMNQKGLFHHLRQADAILQVENCSLLMNLLVPCV